MTYHTWKIIADVYYWHKKMVRKRVKMIRVWSYLCKTNTEIHKTKSYIYIYTHTHIYMYLYILYVCMSIYIKRYVNIDCPSGNGDWKRNPGELYLKFPCQKSLLVCWPQQMLRLIDSISITSRGKGSGDWWLSQYPFESGISIHFIWSPKLFEFCVIVN